MADDLSNNYRPPEDPIPDSFGVSCMCVRTVRYLWRISNFSFWDSRYIDSPVFSSAETSSARWRLRLYPRNVVLTDDPRFVTPHKCHVGIHLILDSWWIKSFKAKCQFAILNAQGEKCTASSLSDFHVFGKWSRRYKCDAFANRDRLLDGFLVNDELSVLCEIKMCMGSVYELGPSPAAESLNWISQV